MKFFLSHSSSDKDGYVRQVADRLGDRAAYDEYSFESGMETLDEIFRTMDASDIFVLFISDAALNSAWVQREIVNGKRQIDEDRTKRFVPILIDKGVSHLDARIPDWIRDRYNIRLVAKPVVALRRLNTAFAQLSLSRHPSLERRQRLFVGRNKELSAFERRFDDYTKSVPAAVVVSGMREVGRKTFMLQGLKKTNKIAQTYVPISISLQPEDGIEGLISKIYDIGFYPSDMDISSLSTASVDEKKDMLLRLLTELYKQNEVLLVDDWRSIVRYGGEVSEWFVEICDLVPANHTVLAVASASRPKMGAKVAGDTIFSVRLSELDPDERMGLMVRYLREVEGKFDIEASAYAPFKKALNGYPEQAIYAGQLIASEGLSAAQLRLSDIHEFSRLKASVHVEKYDDDKDRREFMELLSWFEFLSIELIGRLAVMVDLPLMQYVDELLDDAVCDLVGSVGEYVRLNDIIRDYLARGSSEIPPRYARAITVLSREIFSGQFADYDYSEKYAAVRISLLQGIEVPESLLITAQLFGAIAQKYKNRRYSDVIELCDRVMQRDNYEQYIKAQVRHYLCMALARTRDNRFLSEVQSIRGEEHNYVLGFYYRMVGRYDEALNRLSRAISDGRWEENAKREIVLIYNITENYTEAFSLARESYRKYPSNAITVQAYFEVLLNVPRSEEILAELKSTLETIGKLTSEKAEEIGICMRARHVFTVEQDSSRAFSILDEGISRFPKSPYPLLAKLEFGMSLKRLDLLDSTLKLFKQRGFSADQGKVQTVKADIMRTALAGEKGKALSRIDSELGFVFPAARDRFRGRILGVV
jgi:tetratricopeptide (TPR) repeat protein